MGKEISHKIARVVSNIFVPPSNTLLIFIYLAVVTDTVLEKKLLIFFSAFLLGFIIPIIFFVFLMKRGSVKDVDATMKEERKTPYLFGIFLSFLALFLLYYFEAPLIVLAVWISYIVNTIFLLVINKYWKISAHALGVAAPAAVFIFVEGISGIWIILLIMLIGWSRLRLKVHTLNQVIAGALLGFLLTYGIIYTIVHYLSL